MQVSRSKPTTLAEDQVALQELQSSQEDKRRLVLARQFVIGKKQLLQSCIWQYAPGPVTALSHNFFPN